MSLLRSYWFWIGVSIAVLIIVNFFYKPVDPSSLPSLSPCRVPEEEREEREEERGEETTPARPTYRAINANRGALHPRVTNRSRGEAICCQVMEELTGLPFGTVRPDFLKNPETRRNLEIDCYNDQLKIGVEYNGIQHYVWPNFTGQSYDQFINQVRRDQYKVRACDQHGVYLITVPYTISHDQIRDFLIDKLAPLGISNQE